ncbi:MAG: hypothetical protein QOI01_2322 [Mycobacterium sp.]|jgi:hypothetical protein|nr:hypothetical protein [Mycobacterium sp.]
MRHYPRYRRFRLGRPQCACGLRWPCPDRTSWADGAPIPDGEPYRLAYRPGLTEATMAFSLIGRAGQLTPAQARRADHGDGR